MHSARVWLVVAGAAAVAAAVACSPSRDVVPETHDVRVDTRADAGADRVGGYAYVATRPHGTLALGGVKVLSADDARRLVDRLADDFESCAARLDAEGALVTGAARLVVAEGPNGSGEVSDMQLAPGGPVAHNALLCLVAPARAMAFTTAPASADAGVAAILVDAAWNPSRAREKRPIPNGNGAVGSPQDRVQDGGIQ